MTFKPKFINKIEKVLCDDITYRDWTNIQRQNNNSYNSEMWTEFDPVYDYLEMLYNKHHPNNKFAKGQVYTNMINKWFKTKNITISYNEINNYNPMSKKFNSNMIESESDNDMLSNELSNSKPSVDTLKHNPDNKILKNISYETPVMQYETNNVEHEIQYETNDVEHEIKNQLTNLSHNVIFDNTLFKNALTANKNLINLPQCIPQYMKFI